MDIIITTVADAVTILAVTHAAIIHVATTETIITEDYLEDYSEIVLLIYSY